MVSRVKTTEEHNTSKAQCECSRDGHDYLALQRLSLCRLLLTSSTRNNKYSPVCKTEAGFRGNEGGSCGVQQAMKVVKSQMVRGEGSGACSGHQQGMLAGRDR